MNQYNPGHYQHFTPLADQVQGRVIEQLHSNKKEESEYIWTI
jgi:hypothetical protein